MKQRLTENLNSGLFEGSLWLAEQGQTFNSGKNKQLQHLFEMYGKSSSQQYAPEGHLTPVDHLLGGNGSFDTYCNEMRKGELGTLRSGCGGSTLISEHNILCA